MLPAEGLFMTTRTFVIILIGVIALVGAAVAMHHGGSSAHWIRVLHGGR